jgi:hypothetical protein
LKTTRGYLKRHKDVVHLVVSLLLFVGAWEALHFRRLGWPAVIGIDLYLFGLVFLAARRRYSWLPTRLLALFTLPITFFALVLAFATVFLKCHCFEKRDLHMDSQTKKITVSSTRLCNAVEATYVSLAVITTAAPDYAPNNPPGRFAVAVEAVSGLLFLLVAFPILAARLADFAKEEASGPPGVAGGGATPHH